MTSTNDGKDVKSNQTISTKSKTYLIELYKSLEARLNEAGDASERTKHLCEAWGRVHSLCLHSAPSTHTHLLAWLQRHTARATLQTEWQTPKRKDDREALAKAIDAFIAEASTSKHRGKAPWEVQLVERGEWFKSVLENPWGHPVLTRLLNPSGAPPTDDEVLSWLKEERGVTFVVRLHTLVGEKCDDIAVSLAAALMERVRASPPLHKQASELEAAPPMEKTMPSFGDKLKEEAGFTPDVWESLTDIEFVLLHKRDSKRCIALAKQTPLLDAYPLIERLQKRLEMSPREKRLWKNAREVAILIAQVVIARCMVVKSCSGAVRTALYCCSRLLSGLLTSRLPSVADALAAQAPTARHLHTLAQAVDKQLSPSHEDMKPYVCELYVRAITAGMNELERLKLKTEKEVEARSMEKTLASWFVQLGVVLSRSLRIASECTLTAFSLHPSHTMYQRIHSHPPPLPVATDSTESKEETVKSEFGSWANDSRSQTNLVKTSETLNMKHKQNQANVLSTAIFNEGEALGLSPELCQDLAVLLAGPRVKTLSWDMDRTLLLENCRAYSEMTHGGTRVLTRELKYLNIDLNQYQHLPEERDEDENDPYYGIERGYEHLAVLEDPEDIWADADPEKSLDSSSNTEENFLTSRKKNNTRRVLLSSDEDSDPLSLVAEVKRTQKKKERPHSKERSKERAKKKQDQEPADPLRIDEESKKEPKQKKEPRKKEKIPKVIGGKRNSLASLVGLKVGKTKKKHKDFTNFATPVADSDYDSQGKNSLTSLNSQSNDHDEDTLRLHKIRESKNNAEIVRSVGNVKKGTSNVQRPANNLTKMQYRPQTYNPQRPQTPNSIIRQQSPSTVRSSTPDYTKNIVRSNKTEDVRANLNKLLEYRRQRDLQEKLRNQNTVPLSPRKPAIMRPEISLQTNNISPKTVAIPEIPKSYINKEQTEKLAELMRAQREHIVNSSVIHYANKSISNKETSDSKIIQKPNASTLKMNDIVNTSYDRLMAEIAERHRGQERNQGERKELVNPSQPQYRHTDSPMPVQRSYNVTTPGQRDFQDFLKDYETRKYNNIPTRPLDMSAKPTVKDVRKPMPMSRVVPVIPNIPKVENKPMQNSKLPVQPLKKPEASLNTFSRLSYMHKNKQNEAKNKAPIQKPVCSTSTYQEVSSELDEIIKEHQLAQMRVIQAKKENADRPTSKLSSTPEPVNKNDFQNHPLLSNLLSNQSNSSQSLYRHEKSGSLYQSLPATNALAQQTTATTNLTEKDHDDLLNLLHQKRKQDRFQQYTTNVHYKPYTPSLTKCESPIDTTVLQKQQLQQPNRGSTSKLVTQEKPSKSAIETKIINILSNTVLKPGIHEINKSLSVSLKRKEVSECVEKTNKIIGPHDNTKKNEVNKSRKTKSKDSEWKSVMSDILKHKTPCRGPNALDVALNKSSFEIAFEKSLKEPSLLQSKLPSIEPDSTTIKHQEKVDRSKPVITSLQNVIITKKGIKIQDPTKQEKNLSAEPKAYFNKPVMDQKLKIQTTPEQAKKLPQQTQRKQFTYTGPKHDDPFISGIHNSDYDLLEELMDDDLRKEIGELSSDDESYNTAAQSFLKTPKNDDNKRVGVQFKKDNNEAAPRKSLTDIHCVNNQQQTSEKVQSVTVQTPSQCLNNDTKISLGTIQQNAASKIHTTTSTSQSVITQTSTTSNIQNQIYNSVKTLTNNQMLMNSNNIYISAVPQATSVQNVVLVGSELVYGGYSSIQTTVQSMNNLVPNAYVAVNNTPTMTLYHTTQYVAPVVIGASLAVPAVNNITCGAVSVQTNVINVAEPTYSPANIEQQSSTTNTQISMKATDSYTETDFSNRLYDITQGERKVLSEVQDFVTTENVDNTRNKMMESEIMSTDKKKDAIADKERLKTKRLAIINREIYHRCLEKTIALSYSPLPKVQSVVEKPIFSSIAKEDKQHVSDSEEEKLLTQIKNNLQDLSDAINEVQSPATPDSTESKENKIISSLPCRRILLRSSNKLILKQCAEGSGSETFAPNKAKAKLKSNIYEEPNKVANKTNQSGVIDKDGNASKRVSRRINNKKTTETTLENKPLPNQRRKQSTEKPLLKNKVKSKNQADPPVMEYAFDIEAELKGSVISKSEVSAETTDAMIKENKITEASEAENIIEHNTENKLDNQNVDEHVADEQIAKERNHDSVVLKNIGYSVSETDTGKQIVDKCIPEEKTKLIELSEEKINAQSISIEVSVKKTIEEVVGEAVDENIYNSGSVKYKDEDLSHLPSIEVPAPNDAIRPEIISKVSENTVVNDQNIGGEKDNIDLDMSVTCDEVFVPKLNPPFGTIKTARSKSMKFKNISVKVQNDILVISKESEISAKEEKECIADFHDVELSDEYMNTVIENVEVAPTPKTWLIKKPELLRDIKASLSTEGFSDHTETSIKNINVDIMDDGLVIIGDNTAAEFEIPIVKDDTNIPETNNSNDHTCLPNRNKDFATVKTSDVALPALKMCDKNIEAVHTRNKTSIKHHNKKDSQQPKLVSASNCKEKSLQETNTCKKTSNKSRKSNVLPASTKNEKAKANATDINISEISQDFKDQIRIETLPSNDPLQRSVRVCLPNGRKIKATVRGLPENIEVQVTLDMLFAYPAIKAALLNGLVCTKLFTMNVKQIATVGMNDPNKIISSQILDIESIATEARRSAEPVETIDLLSDEEEASSLPKDHIERNIIEENTLVFDTEFGKITIPAIDKDLFIKHQKKLKDKTQILLKRVDEKFDAPKEVELSNLASLVSKQGDITQLIPNQYVTGLINDIENKLASDVKATPTIIPEVVEIDDSSNDSLYADKTTGALPNENTIDELKNKLLEQLVEVIQPKSNLILHQENQSVVDDDVQMIHEIFSPKVNNPSKGIKLSAVPYGKSCRFDSLDEEEQVKIKRRKCAIKLTRCDDLVKIHEKEIADVTIKARTPVVEEESIRITEDFSIFGDLDEKTVEVEERSSSPVIELFDMIVSLENKAPAQSKSAANGASPFACRAAWFTTKPMLHSQIKNNSLLPPPNVSAYDKQNDASMVSSKCPLSCEANWLATKSKLHVQNMTKALIYTDEINYDNKMFDVEATKIFPLSCEANWLATKTTLNLLNTNKALIYANVIKVDANMSESVIVQRIPLCCKAYWLATKSVHHLQNINKALRIANVIDFDEDMSEISPTQEMGISCEANWLTTKSTLHLHNVKSNFDLPRGPTIEYDEIMPFDSKGCEDKQLNTEIRKCFVKLIRCDDLLKIHEKDIADAVVLLRPPFADEPIPLSCEANWLATKPKLHSQGVKNTELIPSYDFEYVISGGSVQVMPLSCEANWLDTKPALHSQIAIAVLEQLKGAKSNKSISDDDLAYQAITLTCEASWCTTKVDMHVAAKHKISCVRPNEFDRSILQVNFAPSLVSIVLDRIQEANVIHQYKQLQKAITRCVMKSLKRKSSSLATSLRASKIPKLRDESPETQLFERGCSKLKTVASDLSNVPDSSLQYIKFVSDFGTTSEESIITEESINNPKSPVHVSKCDDNHNLNICKDVEKPLFVHDKNKTPNYLETSVFDNNLVISNNDAKNDSSVGSQNKTEEPSIYSSESRSPSPVLDTANLLAFEYWTSDIITPTLQTDTEVNLCNDESIEIKSKQENNEVLSNTTEVMASTIIPVKKSSSETISTDDKAVHCEEKIVTNDGDVIESRLATIVGESCIKHELTKNLEKYVSVEVDGRKDDNVKSKVLDIILCGDLTGNNSSSRTKSSVNLEEPISFSVISKQSQDHEYFTSQGAESLTPIVNVKENNEVIYISTDNAAFLSEDEESQVLEEEIIDMRSEEIVDDLVYDSTPFTLVENKNTSTTVTEEKEINTQLCNDVTAESIISKYMKLFQNDSKEFQSVVEFEDPEAGTCYVIPIIRKSSPTHFVPFKNSIESKSTDVLEIADVTEDETVTNNCCPMNIPSQSKDIVASYDNFDGETPIDEKTTSGSLTDVENVASQLIDSDNKYNNSAKRQEDTKWVSSIKKKRRSINLDLPENLSSKDTESLILKVPERTYSTCIEPIITRSKSLKRKIDLSDIKTSKRKYRKAKNIDYPKFTVTSLSETVYQKEYKCLIDYCSSIKFSYSMPFHKENINVQGALESWPISETHTSSDHQKTPKEIECNGQLFDELDKCEALLDPLRQTLVEEISSEFDENSYTPSNIQETNFKMGFGERSDRVIQESIDGEYTFSAATLSDVKQLQPLLPSDDKGIMRPTNVSNDNDQRLITMRFVDHLHLRERVRTFFEKSKAELNLDWKQNNKKDSFEIDDDTNWPFGDLTSTKSFRQSPIEVTVNVVQVGQLPVSAAAQNPVSCDPRVTHVSNASPSQCSPENSMGELQTPIKTEYTELTTANITLPLMQEYVQHHHSIPSESPAVQSSHVNTANDSMTMSTEIKSIVKIELMEETSQEGIDDNVNYEDNGLPQLPNENMSTNIQYQYENVTNNLSTAPISNAQVTANSSNMLKIGVTFSEDKQDCNVVEKSDQLAHAMNAAGIPSTKGFGKTNNIDTMHQHAHPSVTVSQANANSFPKTTSINAITLQQALAQILPPPLNQTNVSENNSQTSTNPQVLHIVQGNNTQSVINKPNGTQLLHIVQNKNTPNNNGAPTPQQTTFSGLSLMDGGIQQGGNQLLHIVNAANQKNANAGQLLKRVNLLTNLANVQGSNEQKMVQFVCKSADGKSIQLPHQRSMVLRLQPLDPPTHPVTPKQNDNQDQNASLATNQLVSEKDSSPHEMKSRSLYEENYAKFVQNDTKFSQNGDSKLSPEKATSLPKFNQVFGKQVYQEKPDETDTENLPQNSDSPDHDNAPLDQINDITNPPMLIRKTNQTQPTHVQPNLVQQIKQTIGPMNIQTMHGGVIYTRQIPVNIGNGQTINLITVPSTELVDDSAQKQTDSKFTNQEADPPILKIVPTNQLATTPSGSTDDNNTQIRSNETNTQPNPQPQPVLTQMRIKLPMLSKAPQMVGGTRVVRPSFFQIQRNVIGGANQQVYQQLVLTAAPPIGQSIRLPAQVQKSKTPSESQSSPESQMSSSTLEQLREFDMVLEQVKERSTVQPGSATNNFSKLKSSPDTTDSPASSTSNQDPSPAPTQVLYSVGNTQPLSMVNFVSRKSTITSTATSFARSPDSTGTVESPSSSTHSHMPHTVTSDSCASSSCASEAAAATSAQPKPKKKKPKPSTSTSNPFNIKNTPKPSSQKPLEDEQTTQRILYILAEYKEQVENSPDKDKPAPRRRNNPAAPNSGSSKRKKSSSGSRRRDMSPVLGEDSCRTMGSEDSSCGTSMGECNECLETHSPEESPKKVVRRLTFEQETQITQTRTTTTTTTTVPQRNFIVTDGQAFAVRGATGKPATTVLMPANYLLPVSMVKGGQQIAIVTNRGPKLLVGAGEGGTGGALLFQRLIGPGGLKPVLARPGVRHIRLPTTALHNLQAFNIATPASAAVQPPDSTASPAPAPTPPDLVDTRAMSSPWPDRDAGEVKPERGNSSPEGSEPWNLPSSSIADDYGYEEIVRTDNMDRTVLDAIPDRYSPDLEAQRIFDKMFDSDSKKSMYDSRCGYDIDASDDDKAYHQVVHRKDGRHTTRLTHVSAAALRHKYAILEHELRLQKSLSEECEDLGVDSPSASELFPEAELLFAPSPAHEQTIDHCLTPQPTIHTQGIPHPDLEDQIATDHLLTHKERHDDLDINLDDVGEIVTVGEDGMTTIPLDQEEFARSHEEFARSHPNTTFHSEPEDGEVPPFTIAQGIKGRQITFHGRGVPGTVVMAPQTTVISQATVEATGGQSSVKYSDIDNIINAIPTQPHAHNSNMPTVLVKDGNETLTKFDRLLNESRDLNNPSAIVHSTGNGTQVIRRVQYESRRDSRYLVEESDAMISGESKITVERRDMQCIDDTSSSERQELFFEHSRSERKRSDFSSDSDKCCKSPYDETNSDSSGVGAHTRLDSVIKAARPERRRSDGSSAEESHPPLRTYPPKRTHQHAHHSHHHVDVDRSLTGKTRATDRCQDVKDESRRRASNRGVVKRGCHCCNGSSAAPKPKKSRPKKTNDYPQNLK